MSNIRKPILEQYKLIWLDREGYETLRKTKKETTLSMAQLVKDAIMSSYK